MSAAGPLEGLRVVEVGTHRAGAFAGAILADLGADVVKVETSPVASNENAAIDAHAAEIDRLAFDRSKRSVVVDLARPEGREIVTRLIGWSEVLLEELGAVGLDRLGIVAPTAEGGSAEFVHCSITAFGAESDTAGRLVDPASEELIVQALSGNMDLTGEAGGPPFKLGIPLGDLGAGVYAVIGILGAVVAGGAGRVEVAKFDVAVALLSYMGVGYFADGQAPTRVGTGHSTIFPYNAFRALDGEVVVAPFTQRFWRNFATAIGREDLTQVETYRNFAARLREKEQLVKIFEPILAEKTVAEWVEIFERADVPAGPVLSVRGALELEQTLERGLTPFFTGPGREPMRTAGSPFRVRYADAGQYLPTPGWPPARGEHTEGLLVENSVTDGGER